MIRRRTRRLSFDAVVLLLAVCWSCDVRQPASEYRPEEIMASQRTLDGKQVSDWMMGVNRLYPAEFQDLPAPPRGYRPVYLSHYGRHGSRYITDAGLYQTVLRVLRRGAADSCLTPLGQSALERFEKVAEAYDMRMGELTPLGALQQKEIAGRMVARFPGLFDEDARVEANSTNLERTMLSMLNFTQTLVSLRPDLSIGTDASRKLMGAINQHSPENPRITAEDLKWKYTGSPWWDDFFGYFRGAVDWKAFCGRLFTVPGYVEGLCDPFEFEFDFYQVALNMPSIPLKGMSFFDLFTAEDLDILGRMDNYSFYVAKSLYPGSNGRGCYLSESVWGDILSRTREDLASGVRVRLRFGHDGCMMAMFAMLGLEGWTSEIEDPADAWKVWDVSRIPMASNLQLVLFGRGATDPLLLLMLLNEEPVELPLKSVAPGYYLWDEFVAYCSPLIDSAREALSK